VRQQHCVYISGQEMETAQSGQHGGQMKDGEAVTFIITSSPLER
jgi:hypothetical protein